MDSLSNYAAATASYNILVYLLPPPSNVFLPVLASSIPLTPVGLSSAASAAPAARFLALLAVAPTEAFAIVGGFAAGGGVGIGVGFGVEGDKKPIENL
jgi:hypothetical protein